MSDRTRPSGHLTDAHRTHVHGYLYPMRRSDAVFWARREQYEAARLARVAARNNRREIK